VPCAQQLHPRRRGPLFDSSASTADLPNGRRVLQYRWQNRQIPGSIHEYLTHRQPRHRRRDRPPAGRDPPAALTQVGLIVQHVGAEAALALLQETLVVEAGADDAPRRQSPAHAGGVYLYLAKGRVSRASAPSSGRLSSAPNREAKVEPLTWEECLNYCRRHCSSRGGNHVKITLIGQPGRIVEKADVVLTTMQNTKAPTLPKGLPVPPTEPTTYVVYIARKQWPSGRGDPGRRRQAHRRRLSRLREAAGGGGRLCHQRDDQEPASAKRQAQEA